MKQDNQSKILLLGVSSAALDEANNEIFIADGYLNRRVVVFDLTTGAFKRAWGATESRSSRSRTIRSPRTIPTISRRRTSSRRCTASAYQ
jgi:hypothetical protein